MRSTVTALLVAVALTSCGGGSTTQTSTTKATSTPKSAGGATARPVANRTVPALIPPSGAPVHSVQVPVVTYHRVHSMPAVGQPDLIVDPATFAGELQALHDAGYHTIHQSQLFDALYKGAALPPKPIIISVDDGYVDDVRTILPDLERLHMVATFFVITGRMIQPGFVTADQIRQLDQAGMDVGDHTAHHLDLPLLTSGQLQEEIAGSRQVLQSVLGHAVYFFAYPFGAFNDNVLRAVKAAGFSMAFTTAGGASESTAAPLTMPRLHVGRTETPNGLVSLLGGA
jgi:peptidoglycan/xylan/chitin deacetylase (PgdA/CDA1 family)